MNEPDAGLHRPAGTRTAPNPPPRCPVCQAPFRGTRLCSRCGADLAPLMRLVAHAWHLRESARSALAGGAVGPALDLVSQAERLQSTPQGARLLTLARWLAAVVE